MKKTYLIIALIITMSLTGCLSESQNKCFEEKGKEICKEKNLIYSNTDTIIYFAYCSNWTREKGKVYSIYFLNQTEIDECNNAKEVVNVCVKYPKCNDKLYVDYSNGYFVKCYQRIKK